MACEKKQKKLKRYQEEISFKKPAKQLGPISMRDASTSYLVDEKKVARAIMSVCKVPPTPAASASASLVDINSMTQQENNFAWVLHKKITQVKFLPTNDMRMVVAGNEFGNVAFWNIDSDDEYNGIYVFYPHTGAVSGISIHPFSLSNIISSCYNGFIRVLDVEKESFGVAYYNSEDRICCLSRARDDANSLLFGEGYGSVGSLDLRSSHPSLLSNLHANKINTLDFNSQNTHLMATSSNDGTACIWDLRKLDQFHPKSLKTVKHKGAVNSAYFSPSGVLVATTSMDNNIGVVGGANYEGESMICHPNKTKRWISSFRGIWGWDERFIMVGNIAKKGVDVISADDKKVSYTLESPHINAIPCRLDAHPTIPGLLAASTAGGRIYLWDL